MHCFCFLVSVIPESSRIANSRRLFIEQLIVVSHYDCYLASDIAIINNMCRTLPTLLLLQPLLLLLLRDILGLPGVTAAVSLSYSSSYCEAEGTGEITKTSYVSNVEQAAQLAQDLLSCPGEKFEVVWNGTIVINQSLEISSNSSLTITGQGQQQGGRATIEAGDIASSMFVVRGSSLQLDGVTITGANGTDGGVVEALDGASVSFFDCNISGNTVSSNGGRW